jgi:hypothetical protein
MRLIPSIIFSLISYFMTGLQRTASQFFVFFVVVFMATVFGSSVGFFASATFPSYGKFVFSMDELRQYGCQTSSTEMLRLYMCMTEYLFFSCITNLLCPDLHRHDGF